MAFEQVKKTEADEIQETIWELWLWAQKVLDPDGRPSKLIKKIAQPQINELDELDEIDEL